VRGASGLDLMAKLRQRRLSASVIVLTTHPRKS
jgi:FixJ family two-component response regulator